MTGHIGTNTPKFVPSRWGMTALWPYSNGAVQIRVGLELAENCGVLLSPKDPNLEKIHSRLNAWNLQAFRMKVSFSLEYFILAWNVQSRPREFPRIRALAVWLPWKFHSRLKVSFSLENFNPGRKSWNFSIFGSSGKSYSDFHVLPGTLWQGAL